MAADEKSGFVVNDVLLARAFIGGVLVVGLGSWLMGFEVGKVSLIPCIITEVTGHDCPGCGMTRSCLSLARGDLAAAWQFNPFVFFLIPLAVLYACVPKRVQTGWQATPNSVKVALSCVAVIAVIWRWVIVF